MSSHANGIPICSLSTRVSRFLPVPKVCRIAYAANFDGVDLDYSSRPLPSPHVIAIELASVPLPVRSVWIPLTGPWTLWRTDRGASFASTVAVLTGAANLVTPLPLDHGGALASLAIVRRMNDSRQDAPRTRHVLAVASTHLVGGRIHLRQMTALRHLAEEWDFWLGLDLLGSIDPRWEAEAIVALLGPRLCLVRTDGAVLARPTDPVSRPARRALTALIDEGLPRDIVLRPSLRLPQQCWPKAVEQAGLTTLAHVKTRIARVESERRIELLPPSHHVG